MPEAGGSAPCEIVHVATVPSTLRAFLPGQVGYMKSKGFSVTAVSSPGEDLERFALDRSGRSPPRRSCHDASRLSGMRQRLVNWSRTRGRGGRQSSDAHTPKAGLLGMMAGALAGTPVRVYHLHGLPMETAPGSRRALLKRAEILACRLAHRVIAVSGSLRDVAVEEGICEPSKLSVVRNGSVNGVDAAERFNPDRHSVLARFETRDRFGIPPDARVVGFVGRLVADKGIVELARAWQVVRTKCPVVHLLVVGPFEERDRAPEAETMLRRDPTVHFTGMDWNTPPLVRGDGPLRPADVSRGLAHRRARSRGNGPSRRGDECHRVRRCGAGSDHRNPRAAPGRRGSHLCDPVAYLARPVAGESNTGKPGDEECSPSSDPKRCGKACTPSTVGFFGRAGSSNPDPPI